MSLARDLANLLNSSGKIVTAKIAADAVDGTLIADDALNSEHYAADSIDTEHYASGSVDNTALGADCVNENKIADDSIYTVHIADGSCTAATLATNAVTTNKISNNAVNNDKLSDNAVSEARLATSGTASSSTFLRGDMAWAEAGGGKVLQMVKTAERNTPLSISPGTSTWTDISGLSVSITPSATSSKILVGGHVCTVNPGDHNGRGIGHRILRGSTVIGHAAANGSRLRANSFNAQTYNHGNPAHPLNYLDSPNTTSAVTYKFQVAPLQHNVVYINYGPASSNANSSCDTICYIYVIEIGA